MGILADWQIWQRASMDMMISPCPRHPSEQQEQEGRLSWGLSSYGYDMRLADEFRVFTSRYDVAGVIDPKAFDPKLLEEYTGPHCIIPPNSFALGMSVETFRIPGDVLVLCVGKSSLARCGIVVNVTPLEPEWRGQVTIEISNTTPLPAKVYAGEGIAQLVFFQAAASCTVSYADKKGRYQDQVGVTLPRV